jgi:hypothetical protein
VAQLSARGARTLRRLLAAAFLLLAPGAAEAGVDLAGAWHVLVHFTDSETAHPEQARWHDRIWVFERKGDGLRWVEYPIVVFSDDAGRFERLPSGQYARVLGHWEPSEGQRWNIEQGLHINTRGTRDKSLRGSDAGGWRTGSRARHGSASVVTYQENWSIEGLPELPVFLQEDVLGSIRGESLEGVTRYRSTEVADDGNTLRGEYERDGTRRGHFVMRRTGPVGRLEDRTPEELQRRALERAARSSAELRSQAAQGVALLLSEEGIELDDAAREGLEAEMTELLAGGMPPEDARSALLRRLRSGGAPAPAD